MKKFPFVWVHFFRAVDISASIIFLFYICTSRLTAYNVNKLCNLCRKKFIHLKHGHGNEKWSPQKSFLENKFKTFLTRLLQWIKWKKLRRNKKIWIEKPDDWQMPIITLMACTSTLQFQKVINKKLEFILRLMADN
jgi:hypothetical protein